VRAGFGEWIHALLWTLLGGVGVPALAEPGSERTLGNLALRDALNERRRPGTVAQLTSVYGATAQVEPGEIWRAPTILIDTLRIDDVEVVYGDFHIFKVWDMQDKPAMIKSATLVRHRVCRGNF